VILACVTHASAPSVDCSVVTVHEIVYKNYCYWSKVVLVESQRDVVYGW
jgi:hypothetical protein